MSFPFILYCADTETTSLDPYSGEIIELSIYRFNDDKQRTWCIKPDKYENISPDALRVNGHKIEDLKWETAFGRETYLPANKVLADVENFIMEDMNSADGRVLIGQNIKFDLEFLEELWKNQNTKDTFPFGDRPKLIDTIQLELFFDIIFNKRSEYYNLGTLTKKYGIKNTKAHTAAADTLATKQLFQAQCSHIITKFK